VSIKAGDRVKIKDFSEAHGDIGTVWFITSDGIIVVELDEDEEKEITEGTCWLVTNERDLELIT
jgi:hypothetical protein